MSVSITRLSNSTDLLIRVTEESFYRGSQAQFIDEMVKAVQEFVKTDPEVRIILNEMVRTAFQQVDLLKLVTDTIKQSLPSATEEVKDGV